MVAVTSSALERLLPCVVTRAGGVVPRLVVALSSRAGARGASGGGRVVGDAATATPTGRGDSRLGGLNRRSRGIVWGGLCGRGDNRSGRGVNLSARAGGASGSTASEDSGGRRQCRNENDRVHGLSFRVSIMKMRANTFRPRPIGRAEARPKFARSLLGVRTAVSLQRVTRSPSQNRTERPRSSNHAFVAATGPSLRIVGAFELVRQPSGGATLNTCFTRSPTAIGFRPTLTVSMA